MPAFPSEAWMRALCDEFAAHPDAAAAAAALAGVYRFVVEPGAGVDREHVYDLRLSGEEPMASLVEGEEPDLTLRARVDRWRQLITGRLDIGMAVMLRRLRVSGDTGRVLRRREQAGVLMDALGRVPTEWPDA